MTERFKTSQEEFWAGEFGDQYTARNTTPVAVAHCVPLFSDCIRRTLGVESTLELGANLGINTRALQVIFPKARHSVVEINGQAVQELRKIPGIGDVFHDSILTFVPAVHYDLVFTKGVLIHINPNELQDVYDKLYQASSRYILIAEYYNPTPVTIPYRGHQDKLFKRDFAGEMMDRFGNLRLLDYGFVYHRDANFPQDDLTWFLMEKF